jgi:hypothetical protein
MSDFEDISIPQPEPGASGGPPRPPKRTARGLFEEPQYGGSILDEIEQRLTRYPQARVRRTISSISCLPLEPNGFLVILKVIKLHGREHYRVFYGASQRETTHRRAAVLEFGFGLSNGCRLKEYSRGGRAYRWVVELQSITKQSWDPDWDYMPFSRDLLAFWRRPTIRYFQNHLIDLDDNDLLAAA